MRSVTEGRSAAVARVYGDTDPDSHAGAEALARTIRKYWAARGCDVAINIDRQPGTNGHGPHFTISSTIHNGSPLNLKGVVRG